LKPDTRVAVGGELRQHPQQELATKAATTIVWYDAKGVDTSPGRHRVDFETANWNLAEPGDVVVQIGRVQIFGNHPAHVARSVTKGCGLGRGDGVDVACSGSGDAQAFSHRLILSHLQRGGYVPLQAILSEVKREAEGVYKGLTRGRCLLADK